MSDIYDGVEVYVKPLGAHQRGRPKKMVKLPNGRCIGYKQYEAEYRKARKAERKAARKVEAPKAETTDATPATV